MLALYGNAPSAFPMTVLMMIRVTAVMLPQIQATTPMMNQIMKATVNPGYLVSTYFCLVAYDRETVIKASEKTIWRQLDDLQRRAQCPVTLWINSEFVFPFFATLRRLSSTVYPKPQHTDT